jgi:hypothetical protein
MQLEMIKLFIEYHLEMTRRVWDSMDKISEFQQVEQGRLDLRTQVVERIPRGE